MKVPNKIKTLTELVGWIEKEHPKVIELSGQSKIREIEDFNNRIIGGLKLKRFKTFRGIPVKYLK